MNATAPALSAPPQETEEAVVTRHLPLVGYVVSEILGRLPRHVSRDELTAAGLAGLAFAARAYDPDRGVPFARFASNRIRGAILDELRASDWASRSVRSRARRRDATAAELTHQLGRAPLPGELAEALGVGVNDLDAMDHDVQRAVVMSLQGAPGDRPLDELIPAGDLSPDDYVLANERIGYLHDAVMLLPERLRIVVVGYFFEERLMADIAAELGVSESRVSQMRAEALVLLRDGVNSALDPERVVDADRSAGCAQRRREAYFAALAARSDYRSRLSARPVRLPAALAGSA